MNNKITVCTKTQLRAIITFPEQPGKKSAVLFIPGHNCVKPEEFEPYKRIMEALLQNGFITIHLEKSDSADNTGFQDEIDAYVSVLSQVLNPGCIDKSLFFIFGHSTGGILAPFIAREIAAAGIAVFGAGAEQWEQYEIENARMQWTLRGYAADSIAGKLETTGKFIELFYHQKLTPAEIQRHNEFASYFQGNRYQSRHYRYWQEIADLDLKAAWQQADTPVLAIWGEADYLSSYYGHKLNYEIMMEAGREKSKLLTIPALDHYFRQVDSPYDSFANRITGEYGNGVELAIIDWYNRIIEQAK